MKSISTDERHEAVRLELAALLGRHAVDMTAMEVLAIASHMVGQLVALQDRRTVTPDMAMDVVAANIEAGNMSALAELRDAVPEGYA